MSDPVRQHHVPDFYLKAWANPENRLDILRVSPEVKFLPQQLTKNVAVVNHQYDLNFTSTTTAKLQVEKALSRIEGHFSSFLARLESDDLMTQNGIEYYNFSVTDRAILAIYIVTQFNRTPKRRKAIRELLGSFYSPDDSKASETLQDAINEAFNLSIFKFDHSEVLKIASADWGILTLPPIRNSDCRLKVSDVPVSLFHEGTTRAFAFPLSPEQLILGQITESSPRIINKLVVTKGDEIFFTSFNEFTEKEADEVIIMPPYFPPLSDSQILEIVKRRDDWAARVEPVTPTRTNDEGETYKSYD